MKKPPWAKFRMRRMPKTRVRPVAKRNTTIAVKNPLKRGPKRSESMILTDPATCQQYTGRLYQGF
jgi:hypothetical protein